MKNPHLFRAELLLLVAKHQGGIESSYDVKNAIEDYAHDSLFADLFVKEVGDDYIDLDPVKAAIELLERSESERKFNIGDEVKFLSEGRYAGEGKVVWITMKGIIVRLSKRCKDTAVGFDVFVKASEVL